MGETTHRRGGRIAGATAVRDEGKILVRASAGMGNSSDSVPQLSASGITQKPEFMTGSMIPHYF